MENAEMTMYDKYSKIVSLFLDECNMYARVNGGIVFYFKNNEKMSIGDYGTKRGGPTLSYKGMPEIFAKALSEGGTKEQLTDEVYNHYLKCRDENKKKKMSASNVPGNTAETKPQTSEKTIEDELREALGGYGILTDQIMEAIVPVLKKHGTSKDDESIKKLEEAEERIKRLEEATDEYGKLLNKIMKFFYDEIFERKRVIPFSSKFLTPFKGFEPIAKILDFYGVPEKDNKCVATQFNIGIQNSKLAHKTKDNGKTEWVWTERAKNVMDGTYAGITTGVIVNCKQQPLDESLGHEIYFNYDAFCCFIDCMRQDGTVNYDVMNALGLWNRTDK